MPRKTEGLNHNHAGGSFALVWGHSVEYVDGGEVGAKVEQSCWLAFLLASHLSMSISFSFFKLLNYSCFTMLYSFLWYGKVNQSH